MNGALVGSAHERSLNTSMLIAERDLEMEYTLAVALKAEMPRLDHAGMHGANGDLVDFFAVDLKIVSVARCDQRTGQRAQTSRPAR